MNNKRLVFVGGAIDLLDNLSYELESAFKTLGYEALFFDAGKEIEAVRKLLEFAAKPVTAAIFFNQAGLFASVQQGKNLWQQLGIRCIDILMDHPFCFPEDFDRMSPDTIVLCPDKNHMRYVQRFYPHIQITGFLPHWGRTQTHTTKKICERSGSVIYLGGLSRSAIDKVMPDFSQFDFDAKLIADEALAYMLSHPCATTEDSIEKSLKNHGIIVDDNRLKNIIADLHYIDLLAVSHFREKSIRLLVEAGIDVDIYGYGWEICDWIENEHAHYKGRIPAQECAAKMGEYKIVLNTLTWFKDGTHDRIFNGMLAGAVVVTDSSVYLKEEFADNELIMFELNDINSLPDIVKDLLSDEERMQQIADAGYQKAEYAHSLLSRAKELDAELLSLI